MNNFLNYEQECFFFNRKIKINSITCVNDIIILKTNYKYPLFKIRLNHYDYFQNKQKEKWVNVLKRKKFKQMELINDEKP